MVIAAGAYKVMGYFDTGTEWYHWVGYAYAYGIYLFFDFAGYSLMAVGSSYMLGIETPENFRQPFISRDIREFWDRCRTGSSILSSRGLSCTARRKNGFQRGCRGPARDFSSTWVSWDCGTALPRRIFYMACIMDCCWRRRRLIRKSRNFTRSIKIRLGIRSSHGL